MISLLFGGGYRLGGKRTQGLPSGHFPLILKLLFAFCTVESTMYTPYLFSKVVLDPFHAVIPPPLKEVSFLFPRQISIYIP